MKINFTCKTMIPGSLIIDSRNNDFVTFKIELSFDIGEERNVSDVFLHTNHGSENPAIFNNMKMRKLADCRGVMIYELSIDTQTPGTYTVTAYIVRGNKKLWVNNNMYFRVPTKNVEGLYVKQVPIDKANARYNSDDISTISDMLTTDYQMYNLTELKRQGVNCIWFQTPYRIDHWEHGYDVDTAGSDYASTDWLSIDPEISEKAKLIPEWDKNKRHTTANNEMKFLIDQAHKLNMKVVFGIAPNHVGHNYIFRDYFVESHTVKSRDYSQIAIYSKLDETKNLIEMNKNTEIADFAEYIYPKMYASKDANGKYNPYGADDVSETYSPNWYGEWNDVKHLNHGAHAGQNKWDVSTEENQKVLDYIGRVMLWAVVELGVDGFRIDHSLGMPYQFFTQTLPWVEWKARTKLNDFESLILLMEDHNRKQFTSNVGDVIQSNWYLSLLKSFGEKNLSEIWNIYNHPQFLEFTGSGNHDEHRGLEVFSGQENSDLRRFGNTLITMLFMGGPVTTLAGDEYGEAKKLHFKGKGGIPTLWQVRNKKLPEANKELCYWISKAGVLREQNQALQTTKRERLICEHNNTQIMGFEKMGDEKVLNVFSNLDTNEQNSIFRIGSGVKKMLDKNPESYFQVKDLFSFYPDRPLWKAPIKGKDIKNIYVVLDAYKIQVLEIYKV